MTRTLLGSFSRVGTCCLLALSWLSIALAGDYPPQKYAVELTASIQESPAKIALTWPGDSDSQGYRVARRTLDSGWQTVANLGGGAVSFEDNNVQVGQVYEYQLIKQWTGPAGVYNGYGYIRSGIKAPLVDIRGKIILLVENSIASALGGELDQLHRDLVGDGWQVVRQNVSVNDSPNSVRDIIRNAYNSDPANVKAVFLLGHVAVPYSGNIVPDGHENHQGAWPADVYYGDVDGNWTDSYVNITAAERDDNWNVPGDGKFDQNEPPSTVELQVGRVDLSNMTCYANKTPSRSELDLMRQYLQKDHAFRIGGLNVARRGIICDNFSDKGKDPIAGCAWRSYPTFFGQGQTDEEPWDGYFPAATANSYLWSFASGGGSYYYSMGVGTSDDFALKDIKAVFTMWMGSYFGDWNNESNFLRAPLGSGYALTSTYSGFPSTWYFPMGLGETIGNCILMSQNNNTNGLYAPWDQGSHQVHISLHGDPTLKMFPVLPPTNLSANSESANIALSWSPSADQNIVGYHVYRSASSDGPFVRVTASPVKGNSYSDSPPAGSYTYMVRTVKLEQSGSGSFYNPSQGIFANANSNGSIPQPPSVPTLQAAPVSFAQVNLSWSDVDNELGYKLERKTGSAGIWSEIDSVGAGQVNFADIGLTPSTQYYYRIRAFNAVGYSAYSAEVRAVTPAAPAAQGSATFVELNSTTQGNWPDKYGADGYIIAEGNLQLPSSIQVSPSLKSDYIWEPFISDVRALLITPTNSQRIAAAWYGDEVVVDINVGADQARRMAVYIHDWDQSGRSEKLEIIDAGSGAVLDSKVANNFTGGQYYVYDIKGAVRLKATKLSGPNAVVAGIFFGGPVPGPISNKALRLALQKNSSSSFTCTISGDPGQKFALQSSTDLKNWTSIQSATLSATNMQISVNNLSIKGGLYFRTQNEP